MRLRERAALGTSRRLRRGGRRTRRGRAEGQTCRARPSSSSPSTSSSTSRETSRGSLQVRSPYGSDCDVEVPMDKTVGLLLTRAPDGAWIATACSVVEPGPLVAEGGEPRGGIDQGRSRDRHPRRSSCSGPYAGSASAEPAPTSRAHPGRRYSAREVRARPRRRGRPDGRRHRAGGRGLRAARLAPRRGAGSGRAGARRNAEEPRQARREGRRCTRRGARTRVPRRGDRRSRPAWSRQSSRTRR